MIKRLRRRFVWIVMTIVTVMLCVILVQVVRFTAQSMAEQSQNMMQMLMPIIGAHPGREEPPPVQMPYISVIVDKQGNMELMDGYMKRANDTGLQELVQLVLEEKRDDGILWEHALRFRKNEGPLGKRIVIADISANLSTLGTLTRNCMAIGTMAWLAFWILSIGLSRWVVRPVEEAWQQQKQFVADASHELKTPLTVITTNAELLQLREQNQQTDNILTMARQMRRLLEDMLELARVDDGSLRTEFRAVDLSGLAEDALLPFEPLFFEKDLILTSQIGEKMWVEGSGTHLKQVMDILLDNALKYSTPGGTVTVTLKRHGVHALLTVANPGEAIPREDLSNIFKRFYRQDKARSRDGSYGLGLPIAQGIVEEHKGKIWAESSGGVNVFFVQLPLL